MYLSKCTLLVAKANNLPVVHVLGLRDVDGASGSSKPVLPLLRVPGSYELVCSAEGCLRLFVLPRVLKASFGVTLVMW